MQLFLKVFILPLNDICLVHLSELNISSKQKSKYLLIEIVFWIYALMQTWYLDAHKFDFVLKFLKWTPTTMHCYNSGLFSVDFCLQTT